MTPQTQCDRCHHLGPVTFDEEQGFLCQQCLNHFTEQRARDLDEKERYDNSPFNWDGMPYAYDE
jgi:transposase-like protein